MAPILSDLMTTSVDLMLINCTLWSALVSPCIGDTAALG